MEYELTCPVCLELFSDPIILTCGHNLCSACLQDVAKLSEAQGSSNTTCPLCQQPSQTAQKNTQLRNAVEAYRKSATTTASPLFCSRCKDALVLAIQECKTCKCSLCKGCYEEHLSNPKSQNHTCRPLSGIKLCKIHHEVIRCFCRTDRKFCCLVCAYQSEDHRSHDIASLEEALESLESLRLNQGVLDLKASIAHRANTLTESHILALQKLQQTEEALVESVQIIFREKRQIIMEETNHYLKKYSSALETIDRLIFEGAQAQDMVDQIRGKLRIQSLQGSIPDFSDKREVRVEFASDLEAAIAAIKNSVTVDVGLQLAKESCIYWESKILSALFTRFHEKHLTMEALESTISPHLKARLLYRMTRDGASADKFHQLCDDQGATVLLIHANKTHAFGAYTPLAWSTEGYWQTNYGTRLFSLLSDEDRPPVRLEHGVNVPNSTVLHRKGVGPMFGRLGYDLCLSFDNLEKSSSRVRTFVLPHPYEHREDTFLAGKNKDWKVEEVEVFAVSS